MNADGSVVSTWSDRSGNNLNAIQGDVNKLVAYKQNGLNNLATIQIEAGKTLTLPDIGGIKMLFVVMKQDAGKPLHKPFGGAVEMTNGSAKLVQSINGQYTLASTVSSQQFNIISLRLAPGNQGFWVNGTFIAGDVNATGGLLKFIGNGLVGEVAEVVGYTNSLANLTRVKIEGTLASKWGLLSLLPGDHPHKSPGRPSGEPNPSYSSPCRTRPRTAHRSSSPPKPAPACRSTSPVPIPTLPPSTGHCHRRCGRGGRHYRHPGRETPTGSPPRTNPEAQGDRCPTFRPDYHLQPAGGCPDWRPPLILTGTTSSGLEPSYESSNTAVATVSGKTVTIVGQGITTIRASQAGDRDYNPAQIVEQDLQVTKRDQAITFNPLPSLNLSSGVYLLSATSNSGLAPAFSIDDETIATVQGNQLDTQRGRYSQDHSHPRREHHLQCRRPGPTNRDRGGRHPAAAGHHFQPGSLRQYFRGLCLRPDCDGRLQPCPYLQ